MATCWWLCVWFFCVDATICMVLFLKGIKNKCFKKKNLWVHYLNFFHWFLYSLTDSIHHHVWLMRSVWTEQVGSFQSPYAKTNHILLYKNSKTKWLHRLAVFEPKVPISEQLQETFCNRGCVLIVLGHLWLVEIFQHPKQCEIWRKEAHWNHRRLNITAS